MSPDAFVTVRWGEIGSRATFLPVPCPESQPPYAVVALARHGDRYVLGSVPRGWCAPSGHIEAGETPIQAAVREAHEEVGGQFVDGCELGHYVIERPSGALSTVAVFYGYMDSYGHIPAGSESTGVRLAAIAELPGVYWTWDPLMEQVFGYAEERFAESGTRHG